MDAVKYIVEYDRMCRSFQNCRDCPIKKLSPIPGTCNQFKAENPEATVAIVEKWSVEHPIKTRLMDFLEKHPNAPRENGLPYIRPWNFGYCKAGCCDKCEHWVPADYLYRKCWNLPLEE